MQLTAINSANCPFTELELATDNILIPAVSDRPPVSEEERQILSLPCRNGGLGREYTTQLHHQHHDSAYLIGFPADNLVAQVNSLGAAIGTLAVKKRQAQLVVRAGDKAAAIEIWEAGRKPMKALLEWHLKKELQASEPANPYEDMASPSTKLPSWMVSAYDMAGHLSVY